MNKGFVSAAVATAFVVVAGCATPAPEHVEKPLTTRTAPRHSEFDDLKTPEEKIKFIENSNAPPSEKEKAIAQIKAGKL